MARTPLSPHKNIPNRSQRQPDPPGDATDQNSSKSPNEIPPITAATASSPATEWEELLKHPLLPALLEVLAAASSSEGSNEAPPATGADPLATDIPSTSLRTETPAEMNSAPDHEDGAKRHYRTISTKMDIILGAVHNVNWSLGDFLHYLSEERLKNKRGKDEPRSQSYVRALTRFLRGEDKHHPIHIIEAWFRHSYGRPQKEESDAMYSIDLPAHDIKGAHAAISSFAAQLVAKQLVREEENVVKPSSGLHVIAQSKTGKHALDWSWLGPKLFDDVAAILQDHQPLAWHFLLQMASRPPWKQDGEVLTRENRPVSPIVTDVLSRIAYSRSNRAKLLPMAHGINHFASGAHSNLYRINSRLAAMPSYSTIRGSLVDMAEKETQHLKELGNDETVALRLVIDNVQRYSKRWEPTMNQQSQMLKGMAGTAIKIDDVDPKAWDLDDKLERVARNERRAVTTEWFLSQIDGRHLEDVKVLQWIQTLVRYVPALSRHRKHINVLYATRVQKTAPTEVKKTEVFPLAATEKDEGVTSELKEAIVEFLEQLGQTEDKYIRRVILVGGDGLTYEKMLQIKKYLQFHPGEFQNLVILDPLLELWHTEWTDLCCIFQTHWHEDNSEDPASLGHSASKISFKAPSNLAKVDYYPSTRMAYTVLDARLLDCWRIHFCTNDLFAHFEELEKDKQLPSFEDLEEAAVKLCRMYSSARAYERALHEDERVGKEAAYAVAVGDAGHVYECVKLWLFTFAGSGHSKYTTYLMELITSLELESSPALRAAIFRTWLVNPSSRPGHYIEADLLQEHFNKALEELVQ
ncbi:hypothetical protein EWM64_g3165 [Hericium alpestre]|uniref:DUF6589 domain-containing protein n=1 Tax=Hericium alpestre TaxID=135208 RepID=A0A4Z0A585_9AGAM|nr:hypothetical protein EWM64_g3165 [Hericium alpestre]